MSTLFKGIFDQTGALPEDQVKRYLPSLHANMKWDTARPLVEDAESEFIRGVIDPAFHNELITAYAAYPGTPLSTEQTAVIRKLQRSIAYFFAYKYYQHMLLNVSDMGPTENASVENTAMPSRQWVLYQSQENAFKDGHKHLETALSFMEENATDYPTWKNSNTYTKSKELFFNAPAQLREYFPTYSSRFVYLQLRPAIKQAERRYILPTLGQDFYDELKAAILNEVDTPLSSAQTEVLNYIRTALAQYCLKHAIPLLRLQVNQTGIVEPEYIDGVKNKRQASEKSIRSMWVSLDQAGREFLIDLKGYLDTNADLYPTYKASDSFTDYAEDEQPDTPHTHGNDKDYFDDDCNRVVSFM